MKTYALMAFALVVAGTLACDSTGDRAQARLARALADTLGTTADAQVGTMRDSRHLVVHLAAAPFAGASNSQFTHDARRIAAFVVRRYDGPARLDSVTVGTRETILRQGRFVALRVVRTRTFAVGEFRDDMRK